MYENLYEPLPSIKKYLERIGVDYAKVFDTTTSNVKAPDIALLDELIYAHQCTVPFENLDVLEKGLDVSLGKADLFEKIVTRKRGGYCFELNGLFASLLDALGYDVRASMARVIQAHVPLPTIAHRTNIVTLKEGKPDTRGENESTTRGESESTTRGETGCQKANLPESAPKKVDYLVEVGFGGPMPAFALKLEDNFTRAAHGQTFTAHDRGNSWWEIGYTGSDGEERIVMSLCATPFAEQDFVPLSFYQTQNPQFVFRTTRIVNIRTSDGARNLRDNIYTCFKNGERTTRTLESESEINALLAEKFGIGSPR